MSPGPHTHDHALPDGTTVRMRPMVPADAPLLLAMWDRTSPRSRQLRFHGPFDLNERNVGVFTDYDPATQLALAATTGREDEQRIVGVARYVIDADQPDHAEFAALVEDAHQGRGIGSALVRHVAEAAHAAGVRVLSGDVLAENASMLRLIRELGLAHRSRQLSTVVHNDLELDLTEDFLRAIDDRERTAARAALTRFLQPSSVAVVGASRDPRAVGGQVLDHLVDSGYAGTVFPVNPNAEAVRGLPAWPRVTALPEVPELVVVAVPADQVVDVVDEVGDHGVRAVCILSSGFADDGEPGWRRQADLMRTARGHGLRIVGPNCMGIMNLHPDRVLNASLSPRLPGHGHTALLSQSGVLGTTLLDIASARGVGISSFASVGNKADISGNDLLRYWEEDPDTERVLLYLESFGNPRAFSRIARRVGRRKPILVVKAARTRAGAQASRRRLPLPSSDDEAVEALFAQTGVVRTDTLTELFDVAGLLAGQPLPAGDRVGVVGNVGGPGILAVDALDANGLTVAPLSARTRERLAPHVGGHHVRNPVEVPADRPVADVEAAVRVLGTSDDVDVVLALVVPQAHQDADTLATALVRARGDMNERLLLVAVVMTPDGRVPPPLRDAGIPVHSFPETAAVALGRVVRHARWRRRPLGRVLQPDDVDATRAGRLVRSALAATGQLDHAHPSARSAWLDPVDAHALLDAYGIPRVPSRFVTSPDGAADAWRDLGDSVVVKLVDGRPPDSHHQTVEVGRRSHRAAAAAARDLAARREAGVGTVVPVPRFTPPTAPRQSTDHPDLLDDDPGVQLLVQEMVEDTQMALGVRHDPVFGPVVTAGLGGVLADLIADRTARITPLTDRDIHEMLDDLRMRPLLDGWRGAPPADVDALVDLLARLNALVQDLPEVAEIVMNPVFVGPAGVAVADVHVRATRGPASSPATD